MGLSSGKVMAFTSYAPMQADTRPNIKQIFVEGFDE